MAKVSADKFIDLLGRSGLIDKQQLTAALEELARQRHNGPTDDGNRVADFFIQERLLTRWQADKLLEGRYKSFYLLSKYKLLDHLGTGGMSMVYLAEHVHMHRRVAIKVLPQNRVNDSSYLSRFYNEARAAGALAHPNIVHTYDIDNDGKTHCIVMEYVPGKNLQEIVKAEGPMSYRRAADCIAQAAEGLAYAHEAGLVHRDVKPANLLVDDRNTVKVLDLGLAYFSIEGQASLTLASEDNVLGTADYLAPEQAVNSHNVDGRADIYSLGCTLYFLLTGHPPFDEGPIAARLLAHQTQEPPSIYKARPTAPPELVGICERMMAKRADDRFQSMQEVKAALRAWLEEAADPGSSGRLGHFTESPSAILRRQSPPGAGFGTGRGQGSGIGRPSLAGSSEIGPDRAGGSSVLGRGLRTGSGTLQGQGQGDSASGAKQPRAAAQAAEEDTAELELAVLPDEKRASPSASATVKHTGTSSTKVHKQEPAADVASQPLKAPQKPVDFTTWLSEELSRPSAVAADNERTHFQRQETGSSKMWIVIAVGAFVLLAAAVALVMFLS